MEIWLDYYNILQVHHNAEQEIIQSSYKRLCKKYHPDVNKTLDAADKIKDINIAYDVLSDSQKRREYHREWLRRQNMWGTANAPRPAAAPRPPRPAPTWTEPGTKEAREVVENYFLQISKCDFKSAYKLLSAADRQKTGLHNFMEWQESVASLYSIGSFTVKLFKKLDDIKTAPFTKFRAEEYTVSVAEKNISTNTVTEYSFTKTAILEDKEWKVYLGYGDITPIIQKFKYMASTQDEAELAGHWEHYSEITDLKTGLPNLKGFLEKTRPEMYRLKRYGSKFSIGVFLFTLPGKISTGSQYDRVLKHIGNILNKTVREIDSAAYIGENHFAVLFAETDKANAGIGAKRLMRVLKREIGSCFDADVNIKLGICEQSGDNAEKTLDTCMSIIKSAGDMARAAAGKAGML